MTTAPDPYVKKTGAANDPSSATAASWWLGTSLGNALAARS